MRITGCAVRNTGGKVGNIVARVKDPGATGRHTGATVGYIVARVREKKLVLQG